MSEILPLGDPDTFDRVAVALRDGGLVVLPTDTVYGVVADAFNPAATRRLLRVRGAGRSRPLSVLIRSPRQVVGLAGDVSEAGDRLMAAYWPGAVTIILRASPGLTWDLGNAAGTVGLRIPTDDDLLRVIGDVGPLACSGASRRGQPLPTTVEEAREQLGDKVRFYVDGGERDGAPSTIVDATGADGVETMREGAITDADIQRVGAGDVAWGKRPESREGAPDERGRAHSEHPEALAGTGEAEPPAPPPATEPERPGEEQ